VRRRWDLAFGIAALAVALTLVGVAGLIVVLFLAPIIARIWL
jgi:hypothetical protein